MIKGPDDRFIIERLEPRHDRAGFTCGVPALDAYIQKQAGQDQARNLASVFVLTSDGEAIAGFYTLSAQSILARDLAAATAKKLLRFPLSVTLLGRMAVSSAMRGQNLGRLLLFDALERALLGAKQVASWAVVVDAKHGARDFYLKYTFKPFPLQPDRSYLPMQVIRTLLGSSKI